MVDISKSAASAAETDYEVGQDNIEVFGLDIHNPVFIISAGTIVAFVALVLLFPAGAESFFGWLRPALTDSFDWPLMLAANIFVLFSIFLAISPLGKIRLGGPDAEPDFGYLGWFAMLFAAGMGIGLMFFGVSEPLSHFDASLGGVTLEDGARTDWAPLGGAQGDAAMAYSNAMAATIFHWGLHPWAIYAVVGLALAFFAYNRGLPLTLRSVFYPLLGERVWGWPGHVIDTLAVFATLFGLATSLGFGAEQAAGGIEYLFGIEATDTAMVVLIFMITAVALVSVVAGLDAGVKRLSEINMVLAIVLMLFFLIVGPTMLIVTGIFENTAAYVAQLVPLSNPFGREDLNFMHGWTTFYWAWWISWSPFVGMFIARVSKGRTVREFVTCVLLVPTVLCIVWMSTFGGAAIDQVANFGNTAVAEAADELKLFIMAEAFPLTQVVSFIGIVLVIVFFVTSSDSGSLVIDTITAGGKLDAPVTQRVFWATFEGLVAIALLLGGGLASLQAAAVATGIPFAFLMLAMVWSLYRGLQAERDMLATTAHSAAQV